MNGSHDSKKRANKAIQSLPNWKQFLEIQKELVLFLNWQLRSRHSICRRFFGRLISTLRSSLAKSIMLEIFTGNIFNWIFFYKIIFEDTFLQTFIPRKSCLGKIRALLKLSFHKLKRVDHKPNHTSDLQMFSIVEILNFIIQWNFELPILD